MKEYLTDKINNLPASATLTMAAKARELKNNGIDIIGLSLGEPDFNIPEFIKEAAVKAINDNYNSYTPVDGYVDLKKAISRKFSRDNNLNYSASQIVVSTGAKQSIANVIEAMINPGDEVILLAPFWVSYSAMIEICGGIPVIVKSDITSNFKVTASKIKDNITSKTKMINALKALERQVALAAEQSDIGQEQALELQALKNLDEDSRSAIMKQAEEGFEAGLYTSVNEGIRRLLQTKEFGIADRPGEQREKDIQANYEIGMKEPGITLSDAPVVRRKAVFITDQAKIEKDNEGITFGVNPLVESGNKYEPGKVYYNAELDQFLLYNGPEAEVPFEQIDVIR